MVNVYDYNDNIVAYFTQSFNYVETQYECLLQGEAVSLNSDFRQVKRFDSFNIYLLSAA